MRNLLANTEDKIFFKDRQSRFLLVSAGFLATQGHGRSLDELIGKTDFDIFSRPHAAAAFEDEQRMIRLTSAIEARRRRHTCTGQPSRLWWAARSSHSTRAGGSVIPPS